MHRLKAAAMAVAALILLVEPDARPDAQEVSPGRGLSNRDPVAHGEQQQGERAGQPVEEKARAVIAPETDAATAAAKSAARRKQLIGLIQAELSRHHCLREATTDDWSPAIVAALRKFNGATAKKTAIDEPAEASLETLRRSPAPACQPAPQQAKACPGGQVRNDAGACAAPPPRKTEKGEAARKSSPPEQKPAPVKAQGAPKPKTDAAAGSGLRPCGEWRYLSYGQQCRRSDGRVCIYGGYGVWNC